MIYPLVCFVTLTATAVNLLNTSLIWISSFALIIRSLSGFFNLIAFFLGPSLYMILKLVGSDHYDSRAKSIQHNYGHQFEMEPTRSSENETGPSSSAYSRDVENLLKRYDDIQSRVDAEMGLRVSFEII